LKILFLLKKQGEPLNWASQGIQHLFFFYEVCPCLSACVTDLIFTHALTESREEKSRDPENEKSVQQPCFKARKLEG